jgi:peroxiredoxin
MLSNLMTLVLVSVSATPAEIPQGTQLNYRGTMFADKGEPADTTKSFELTVLLSEANEEQATIGWTLQEKGRGAWPWTGRFGIWQIGKGNDSVAGGPSLLYQREQGTSVVPIRVPRLIPPAEAAKGVGWKQGKFEFQIAGEEKRRDKHCWRIEVTSPYSRNRTVWVSQDMFVVVERTETVFIGQGERHELRLQLESSKVLSAGELQRVKAAFDGLVLLRQQLDIAPNQQQISLDPKQLAALKDRLPGVTKLASDSALAAVVGEAQKDTSEQKNRSGAIKALAKMSVGKPAAKFSLTTAAGKEVSSDQFRDTVTVLHFWSYRDTPLIEPYGQVGYLDFLNRNRTDKNYKIYGVAVDKRLAERATQGRAIAGVRKLKSFMNLSYPILLDDGAILKKFGDPRVTGAKLPLYVVIDARGNVVHYHAGIYEVDRRQGLKELVEVIEKQGQTGE